MESADLYHSFSTFLSEGVRLVGWQSILVGLGALCAIGGVAVWVVSLVLCRGGKNIVPAITSSLMLAFVGAMVGAVYLVQRIQNLAGSQNTESSPVLYGCIAIGLVLVFIAVQGGFAAAAWKSIILAAVLVASVAGAGTAGASLVFSGKPEQLNLLASQVAGRSTEGPWLVESPEATRRIKVMSAPGERYRIEQKQTALLGTYQQLQAMRAQLNVNDVAAVEKFNQFAAAYTAEAKGLKARLAEIQALLDSEAARKVSKDADAEE